MASIFTVTKKFSSAVALLNSIDGKRFPALVSRIIAHLKLKSGRIFSDAEESQLLQVLHVTHDDLHLVLDVSSYIFEQAAYHNVAADKLIAQLTQTGIADDKAQAYAAIWRDQRDAYQSKLVESSLGTPLVLDAVSWRYGISLSQSDVSRTNQLNAIFTLGLRDNTQNISKAPSSTPAATPSTTQLQFELSRDQLLTLYQQCETIQQQLDGLTDK